MFAFYVPGNWSILLFRAKGGNRQAVKLVSETYYFHLWPPFNIPFFYLDINTSTLSFTSIYVNSFYRTYWQELLTLFESFSKPFFKKLKFKGKGYYIYKSRRNTITPQFGYAHRLYVYSFFTSVFFLNKTTIMVFGLLKADVNLTALRIKRMRVISIYTGRGVRFSREAVYRKVGKVSSYR
jgi:ribosomal protein L6P/L9E